MRQAAEVEDDLAFMRLDRRFNLLMAQASRNEFAVRSMGLMNALSRRFWYQHYKEVADLPLAARLHAEDFGDNAPVDDVADNQRGHSQKKIDVVWHNSLCMQK